MELNFTMVIEVVSFVVLMVVMTKLLYKPVIKVLDDRVEKVKNLIGSTERDRESAGRNLKESETRLTDAKRESLDMINRAVSTSRKEAEEITIEAKASAKKEFEEAEGRIIAEREKARKELSDEVAGMSISIAEKVVEKTIKKEDHEKFIKDYLKRIGKEKKS